MNVISLEDVWLKYKVKFKEDGRIVPVEYLALKGINLKINKGESTGIIGENGAGKTTLLRVIAGMLKPDKGIVYTAGTVSAMMEIGVGFQKDLTGRDNVYLISSLFGLNKEQIDSNYNEIVKFASIGRFINAPVKCYSQGMYMRLAFAIAIHVNPDILLVDDTFIVGDLYAQNKCISKMSELKGKGKTIVFVTHDIEMAKRFCQRGILLKDGRIIKDGILKEAIACYLTTVGDKKGVGVLQGGRLGAVFNNGKLLLSWNGDAITAGCGGYLSIFSGGNWYSSLQCEWELKDSREDKIVLEGKCWDLPVMQLWEIKFDGVKNEVDIKVYLEIQKVFSLDEAKISFIFKEDYASWFNPFHNELFKTIDLSGEFSWKCINSENPPVNYVGLRAADKYGMSLPTVILEDDLYMPGKLLEIQDTDRVSRGRALQSRIINEYIGKEIKKHLISHIRIRIIDKPRIENEYQKNTPIRMLPKVIDNKNRISLSADDNKGVVLYWKDKRITFSKGFQTSFFYNNKSFYSSDGVWDIHKDEYNRMEIAIKWIDCPMRQLWHIELSETNKLSWKVYMEAADKVTIRNGECNIMFSAAYNKWFNSEQQGYLKEEMGDEVLSNIVMKNDPYGIIGLRGVSCNDLDLPYVVIYDVANRVRFNSLERKFDRHAGSNDSDTHELITNAYFLDVNCAHHTDSIQGPRLINDTQVLICDNELDAKEYIGELRECKIKTAYSLRRKPVRTDALTIENRQYKLSFSKGRAKLFFRNKEVTKNFGLYASLYSEEFHKKGQWYASLDGIWEIIRFSGGRLIARGMWPYLPVAQIWEIKAVNGGFVWKVDMEVFAPTRITRQQAYLMLSDRYAGWGSSDGRRGGFLKEFSLWGWDILYKERNVDKLNITTNNSGDNDNFPDLIFSCIRESDSFEARIENSNITFNSRIIGFEKVTEGGGELFNPGVYRYFYGGISFKN